MMEERRVIAREALLNKLASMTPKARGAVGAGAAPRA